MDVIDDYNRDRYNPVIHDFIKKLPGVTSRNVYAILNKVNSMGELLALSAEDLTDIVGKGNATMLYDSLHTIVRPREAAPATAAPVPSTTPWSCARRQHTRSLNQQWNSNFYNNWNLFSFYFL